MTSPFPGMDPYLEGDLWPDVHQSLAVVIKNILASGVGAGYVVRTNTYTVKDTSPEQDVGIMYPDVDVLLRSRSGSQVNEPYQDAYPSMAVPPITPATLELPNILPVEVRIPVVEIRDRSNNQLVTAIEILSPVNKRQPGLETYRKKRQKLIASGIHLVEIDLLRRGERPIQRNDLPQAHYIVTLVRAHAHTTEVWAFNLDQPMPVLPVPLKSPDPDVPLPLREALDEVYDRSMYQRSINYQSDPPPPALTDEYRDWMREWLTKV